MVTMQPKIPSITGNPAIDSLLAAAILSGSGALTAYLVTLLEAHNVHVDPLQLGSLIVVIAVAAVTTAWRFIVARTNPKIIEAAQIQAANATLAMVAAKKMLTDGTGAPVPVTPGTIKQIIASHGTGDGTVKAAA